MLCAPQLSLGAPRVLSLTTMGSHQLHAAGTVGRGRRGLYSGLVLSHADPFLLHGEGRRIGKGYEGPGRGRIVHDEGQGGAHMVHLAGVIGD